MLSREPERQTGSPQQRRSCQVWIVSGKAAELDHGAMLPQGFRSGQPQIAGGCNIGNLARRLISHHFCSTTL